MIAIEAEGLKKRFGNVELGLQILHLILSFLCGQKMSMIIILYLHL